MPLFPDGASFRDFFKRTYGPTIAVYRFLADDPARTAELDEALAAHGDRYVSDGPMEWEYLLFTAAAPEGALRSGGRVGQAVRDLLHRPHVDVVGGALERGVVGAVRSVAGTDVTGVVHPGLVVAGDEGAAGRGPVPEHRDGGSVAVVVVVVGAPLGGARADDRQAHGGHGSTVLLERGLVQRGEADLTALVGAT